MKNAFNLKIYSPSDIILDMEVKKVFIETLEGQLTILPHFADYVGSFGSNVMTFVDSDDKRKYVALNSGIFVKYVDTMCVTAYSAVVGDTLEYLKEKLQQSTVNEINDKEINRHLGKLNEYLFNNLKELYI
jgi:alternate F1F0 ATPase F1 subunit epsilon